MEKLLEQYGKLQLEREIHVGNLQRVNQQMEIVKSKIIKQQEEQQEKQQEKQQKKQEKVGEKKSIDGE